MEDALPDTRKITKVENVVKLGWSWEHLDLCPLPEYPCGRDQLGNGLPDVCSEPSLLREIAFTYHTKYLVNGRVGRQCAVKDGELPLQPSRDIVSAPAWMNHCRQELNVDNVGEVSRFFEAVEPLHFHQLANYFIGDLVSPFIDHWHVDIINKDCHLSTSWRAIRATNTLIYIALDCTLH